MTDNQDSRSKIGWKTYTGGALAAVGTTGALITALGFAPTGIAAGSVAAGCQAYIGNVAAGSTFATFQSLAAKGIIISTTKAGLGSSIVLITPELRDFYNWVSNKKSRPKL